MSAAGRERGWVLAVGGLAAVYFRLGMGMGLEWTDAGQIVYPSWQVARGALPYRDFLQLYGPSVYFFNGGLLRLFGPDLGVLLTGLVLVKAAVAALAYAGARLVAPRPFALAAAALLVAIWGSPFWVFSTPYANYYSTALILAGLVAVAAARRRFLTACAFAGVCFGIAATFKQTTGLFACIGLGLAVLWHPGLNAHPPPRRTAAGADVMVRGLRLAFLAGAFAVVVAYLAPSTFGNACVLAAPVTAALVVVSVGEFRGSGDAALRRRGLVALVLIGMGAAIPVSVCVAFFAAHGALRELAFNTVVGLPHLMSWFDPLAMPPGPSVMLAVAIVTGLGLGAASRQRAAGRVAGAVMVLGAVLAIVVADLKGTGLGSVLRALTLLLFVIAWGGLAAIAVGRARGRPDAAESAPGCEPAVAIFGFTAATAILLLYPAGDLPHFAMAAPLCLPVLAHLLSRWHSAATAGVARPWQMALRVLLAGLLAALAAPFVEMLAHGLAQPAGATRFARARGVIAADRKSGADTAQVIDYLAQQPDGPLLVLSDEQMLYFLAGRDSVVAPYEFALYLVGFGFIHAADAHRLLDDDGFAAQLETQRPLVVDHPGPMTERLRAAYPDVARTLAAHYRPVYRAGMYEVLRWSE